MSKKETMMKKLDDAGYHTMQDLYDRVKLGGVSVYGLLKDIVGSDNAHMMLHELSIRQMFK